MVSIIMATYNRGNFITEAVQSIQNQTYTFWELLIIDDGCIDNTEDILKPFLKDQRIKYLQRPVHFKKGLPGCRNYGLELAKGDFVIFFDDDDVVHPYNLEICTSELAGTDNHFCRYKIKAFTGTFNLDFQKIKHYENTKFSFKDLEKVITQQIPFNSCSVMWRKELLVREKFNEDLMYAEEWEFYTRILSKGAVGVIIDPVLYFARKHPNSNTGEFWNDNPKRKASKTEAVKLVINNLKKKDLLSSSLVKYFIQLAFFLKEPSILAHILNVSEAGIFKKMKYRMKIKFFPILKPVRDVILRLRKN